MENSLKASLLLLIGIKQGTNGSWQNCLDFQAEVSVSLLDNKTKFMT
jgi:hypothetical protein